VKPGRETPIAFSLSPGCSQGGSKVGRSAVGGVNKEAAEAITATCDTHPVASDGRFISKPELPEQLRLDLPLNPYNRDAFCAGDERGHTGSPASPRDEGTLPFLPSS
jgi:hypothetical protein